MFEILTKYSSPSVTFKASSFIDDWEEFSFLHEEYGLWNYRVSLASHGIDSSYDSLLSLDFKPLSAVTLLCLIQKLVRAEREGKGELGRAYSDGLLDGILMSLARKEA